MDGRKLIKRIHNEIARESDIDRRGHKTQVPNDKKPEQQPKTRTRYEPLSIRPVESGRPPAAAGRVVQTKSSVSSHVYRAERRDGNAQKEKNETKRTGRKRKRRQRTGKWGT